MLTPGDSVSADELSDDDPDVVAGMERLQVLRELEKNISDI